MDIAKGRRSGGDVIVGEKERGSVTSGDVDGPQETEETYERDDEDDGADGEEGGVAELADLGHAAEGEDEEGEEEDDVCPRVLFPSCPYRSIEYPLEYRREVLPNDHQVRHTRTE